MAGTMIRDDALWEQTGGELQGLAEVDELFKANRIHSSSISKDKSGGGWMRGRG